MPGANDRHPDSTVDFGDGVTLSTACGHSLATCHIDKCFIAPVGGGAVTGLERLIAALRQSWGQDTAGERYAAAWDARVPALGQCTVSALIIQDYCGGDLARMTVTDAGVEHHHTVNRLAGAILLDVTAGQFGPLAVYVPRLPETRAQTLACGTTQERYLRLRGRVLALLGGAVMPSIEHTHTGDSMHYGWKGHDGYPAVHRHDSQGHTYLPEGQAHLRPVFAEVAKMAATAEEHIGADHEVLKAAHGLVARWEAQAAAAETLAHNVLPAGTRQTYQMRATVLRKCARELGAAFGGVCDEPARH